MIEAIDIRYGYTPAAVTLHKMAADELPKREAS